MNLLSAVLAVSATLFYVFVYTIWLKPRSPQNIVIGGAAGAVPVLVGWAAVTGALAAPAWVLFAIVFFWTPPHFWALSLRYFDDYKAAGIPMLPVGEGHRRRGPPDPRVLRGRRRGDHARAAPRHRHVGAIYLVAAIVLGVVFIGQAIQPGARHHARAGDHGSSRCSNTYLALALRRHCRRHPRPLRLTTPPAAVPPGVAGSSPPIAVVVVVVVGGVTAVVGDAARRPTTARSSDVVAEVDCRRRSASPRPTSRSRRSTAARSSCPTTGASRWCSTSGRRGARPCRKEFPLLRDDAGRRRRDRRTASASNTQDLVETDGRKFAEGAARRLADRLRRRRSRRAAATASTALPADVLHRRRRHDPQPRDPAAHARPTAEQRADTKIGVQAEPTRASLFPAEPAGGGERARRPPTRAARPARRSGNDATGREHRRAPSPRARPRAAALANVSSASGSLASG